MKTLTMRVDDNTYNSIKMAAQGQSRNIANFIEFATMQYLHSSMYVDNSEMIEITNNSQLMSALEAGKQQVQNKEYSFV